MQITFGDACERLRGYSHAYGVTDVGDSINAAVKALSHLSAWKCLRRVLRFVSASPAFALPQGCAGLVRACVNGKPSALRGQDFRFLRCGPGDFGHPPFCPVRPGQILDLGAKPLVEEPTSPFVPVAVASAPDEPPLVVTGIDLADRRVSFELPVAFVGPTGLVDDVQPAGAPVMKRVDSVVVDKCASKTVRLYSDICGRRWQIAEYHPGIRVPQFRHYRIDGFHCHPVEILAEVRLDPFPLVDPDDVLPFDDVEPIQYMIMYDWKMRSSEIDVAQKYMTQAINWLKAQELTEDTVQTEVLVNVPYEGSMGEISDYTRMV